MSAPARTATIHDLLALGDDSRFELIHGELHEKAMGRTEHGARQSALTTVLGRRFARKPGGAWPGGWWFATELHVAYGDNEVFCHDLCGYRRDLHPELSTDWPCTTRPDWVCELLSPGHHKRDRIDKWNVLFRAKVPHYWIVDPEERLLEIHRWTPRGYEFALKATSGDNVRAEPFDSVELRVDVLLGDDDDDE